MLLLMHLLLPLDEALHVEEEDEVINVQQSQEVKISRLVCATVPKTLKYTTSLLFMGEAGQTTWLTGCRRFGVM